MSFCGCAIAFFTAAGNSRILTRFRKTDVSARRRRQPADKRAAEGLGLGRVVRRRGHARRLRHSIGRAAPLSNRELCRRHGKDLEYRSVQGPPGRASRRSVAQAASWAFEARADDAMTPSVFPTAPV